MKCTDLPGSLQKLIASTPYVSLATVCPNGAAWNTPVAGYFDEDLRLYWSSDTRSQHSKNIAHGSEVFAVLYSTHCQPKDCTGLYLQMVARKLTKHAEVEAAKKIYLDRYGEAGHEAFVGNCPRRIYCAEPLAVWMNADGLRGGHFIDVRRRLS